jgi:bacteriocin-like protein
MKKIDKRTKKSQLPAKPELGERLTTNQLASVTGGQELKIWYEQ